MNSGIPDYGFSIITNINMYKINEELLNLPEFAIRWKEKSDGYEESKRKYNLMLQKLEQLNIRVISDHPILNEMQSHYVDFPFFIIRKIGNISAIYFLCNETYPVHKFEEKDVLKEIRTRNSESEIIISIRKVETIKPQISEKALRIIHGS